MAELARRRLAEVTERMGDHHAIRVGAQPVPRLTTLTWKRSLPCTGNGSAAAGAKDAEHALGQEGSGEVVGCRTSKARQAVLDGTEALIEGFSTSAAPSARSDGSPWPRVVHIAATCGLALPLAGRGGGEGKSWPSRPHPNPLPLKSRERSGPSRVRRPEAPHHGEHGGSLRSLGAAVNARLSRRPQTPRSGRIGVREPGAAVMSSHGGHASHLA
jgi:hypothetical protein